MTTDTRALTIDLHGMRNAIAGILRKGGMVAEVELSRRYKRRRYMLTYEGLLNVGHLVMLDVTAKYLWIRPLNRPAGRPQLDDAMEFLGAETLYFDALLREAAAQGFTIDPHGLTVEGLTEWREHRSANGITRP